MRKHVLIFISGALVVLSIVPIINLTSGTLAKKDVRWQWSSVSELNSFDFTLPALNRVLYSFGISRDPNRVIIGKDDWLYLGDRYAKTITTGRTGITAEDDDIAKNIGRATRSWEQWLKLKGVSAFRVMIVPNKNTIYPEFLPDWAQPAEESVTDMLLANVSKEIYVDTRPALQAAKSQFTEPLYYKTDTHWNSLGAWAAFRALATKFPPSEVGMRWLSEQQVRVSRTHQGHGGDLANFLRMTQMLQDSEVTIEVVTDDPVETKQYDFETGSLIKSGGNPRIDTPMSPLLVKAKNGLNEKRVLWLRDSFGTAMAPFMTATFAEILQVHYSVVNPERLVQLVNTYRPDYVFITVVERDARVKWFESLPPTTFSNGIGQGLTAAAN
jgi:alginate O-acetyltransferase complex protein AlgJ